MCSDMMEGCLTCDSYNYCTQCMQDYDLIDNTCKSNGPGVNVIGIALGAACGVIFLVAAGTSMLI